jgi:hypothetical protein
MKNCHREVLRNASRDDFFVFLGTVILTLKGEGSSDFLIENVLIKNQ